MKKSFHPITALILIAGFLILPRNGFAVSGLLQEGESVPGSTTSILFMGIFIVLIIIVPIVWTRRKWMR